MSEHAKLPAGSGAPPTAFSNQWIVRVGANCKHFGFDPTYTQGAYASYARALAICKAIVLAELHSASTPGCTTDQVYQEYDSYGKAPYIVGPDTGAERFCAGTFAKEQCDAMRPPAARAHLATSPSTSNTSFTLIVADNFHYMMPEETYRYGDFDSLEVAVAEAIDMIDSELPSYFKDGMSPEELYKQYLVFGVDPQIYGGRGFSCFDAWDYAKQRCTEICAANQPSTQP